MGIRFFNRVLCRTTFASFAASTLLCRAQSDFHDGSADLNALPTAPDGFEVRLFAREPLIRQPCSMAFDARGRLCVGMGPQYRNPTPDTAGDSVVLVLDTDGDGTAETTRVFATGFNCIQGLAWRGRDLWVANAPDLTVVRDLNGDDTADEYIRIYTDLGNLEHGLHGLNWAPDGRLYMSKGNSKGLNLPDHHAPRPFRELWGVPSPPGAVDFPPAESFTTETYRHAYHDPADDWGREGGIFRCEDGGKNLELIARGFRNPWDIGCDDGFDWLGTDNDQNEGDRVFAPFEGAHFGWNHTWDAGWSGIDEPHIAPVCGPLFQGSGTGVVFGNSPLFPERYRGVWFINDWLRKTTYVFRPHWDGASLGSQGGSWEPFITGGSSLYRPVDLEIGPDGTLWCLGWSRGYGAEFSNGTLTNEGRIYQIAWKEAPAAPPSPFQRGRRAGDLTVPELIAAFDGPLPVWRGDAQAELWRRGEAARRDLESALAAGTLSRAGQTWTAWTLGRMAPTDRSRDATFTALLSSDATPLNLRLQAARILSERAAARGETDLPAALASQLSATEPRLRFEAVQAIRRTRSQSASSQLIARLAVETDRTVIYAGWQALRTLTPNADLIPLLAHPASGVRAAALLALLENGASDRTLVASRAADSDARVRDIALRWLKNSSEGVAAPVLRGRPLTATTPAADPAAGLAPPPAGLARALRVRSSHRSEFAPGGLQPGARVFTDREYRLKRVPADLLGCDFIRTANEDDPSSGDDFLSFESLLPVRVHVAHDTRHRSKPDWLAVGWQEGDTLEADHWTYRLHRREFPAGRITLGGNTPDGNARGHSQYLVILESLPPTPPAQPTSPEAVLALLPQADPARGAALFQQRGAAGCATCHQMNGHGNRFGPDLAGLGTRADARHVIQSILDPSAVVTEGFNLTLIQTVDASFSGILLEESGLSVTLGLPTGERQVISKPSILDRRSAPLSAMPPYASVLRAAEVADLTAWLLQHRPAVSDPAPAPPTPPRPAPDSEPPRPPASFGRPTDWPAGRGFQVATHEDRLVIARDNQPVAHYVFRDPGIARPYFAHAHAPGGLQVTRSHPPEEGRDPTDHADMHPGLWLGFGDLNGHDFWRNKASIEHERFSEPPAIVEGRLQFTTVSRLLGADRQPIGRLVSQFAFSHFAGAHLLTWQATFLAEDGDLVFGDQEEMGFGARVATPLAEKNGGLLLNSSGATTAKATWGQPADWCDYSGTLNGHPCGITLMAAPENFRPSWWHNRDYGVFVANPFGRAAMNQGARSTVTVRNGESLTLRFGAALHAASPEAGSTPSAFYEAFLKSRPTPAVKTPPKSATTHPPKILWLVVNAMPADFAGTGGTRHIPLHSAHFCVPSGR